MQVIKEDNTHHVFSMGHKNYKNTTPNPSYFAIQYSKLLKTREYTVSVCYFYEHGDYCPFIHTTTLQSRHFFHNFFQPIFRPKNTLSMIPLFHPNTPQYVAYISLHQVLFDLHQIPQRASCPMKCCSYCKNKSLAV